MRRVVLLLLAVMCYGIVAADTRSDEILSRMAAEISSLGSYRVEIVVVADYAANGEFVVSGQSYYMDFTDATGIAIICDGKTKYEINSQYKEVTVSNVNPNDKSFLSSPATIFVFANTTFASKYIKEQSVNAELCHVISLVPVVKDSELTDVELAVSVQSGFPVKVTYSGRNIGDGIEIDVKSFKSVVQPPETLFKLDRSKYKDYELVDFR